MSDDVSFSHKKPPGPGDFDLRQSIDKVKTKSPVFSLGVKISPREN